MGKNSAYIQNYVLIAMNNNKINITYFKICFQLNLLLQMLKNLRIAYRNTCASLIFFSAGFSLLLFKNGGRAAANFPGQSYSFFGQF
jgi:hypothetical protein